jgi:type IV pilus assembly protein PilE
MHARANLGFSLMELMIVVIIISILAAVAYPSYRMQVMQSRRAEAQAALMAITQYFEREYSEDGAYSDLDDWESVCAGADGDPKPAYCTYYDIEIIEGSLDADSYLLKAAPKGPQAEDGTLYIDQAERRFWDENNNNEDSDVGTEEMDAGENDWRRG